MSPSEDAAPSPPAVFDEPWQASIFALVVALHDGGLFAWSYWNRVLVQVIAEHDAAGATDPSPHAVRDPAGDGARHPADWVRALEILLAERSLVTPDELGAVVEAWAQAYRTTPHGQPVALEV